MLYRDIGKTVMIAVLALALAPIGAGAQGSPVKNLRLLDAAGQPMELNQIELGDSYYRIPEGVASLKAAFEFVGTQATDVKLKVLGAEGAALFEDTKTLDAPGTYEFVYDAKDQPLQKGEYVVNLYLGKEFYLADSVQLYVGDVQPQQSEASQQETPVATATAGAAPGEAGQTPVDAPAGGSANNSSLLILAGAGIVVLLGIVLWAGRSAMRRG